MDKDKEKYGMRYIIGRVLETNFEKIKFKNKKIKFREKKFFNEILK